MQRTPSSLILSGIAAALLFVASPQAMAQDQPTTPPAEFSQTQIEAFADAATEVQRVQTEFQEQAQQAADPDEVARLQQEAEAEAVGAIEDKGLSTGEYSAIAQAATQDPELYAMIVAMMQERAPQ